MFTRESGGKRVKTCMIISAGRCSKDNDLELIMFMAGIATGDSEGGDGGANLGCHMRVRQWTKQYI